MPQTRGGVYYNLSESPYMITGRDITLIFSSEYNKSRFKTQWPEYLHDEKIRLIRSMGIGATVDCFDYLYIKFYTKIERRGFLIIVNERTIEWQSNLEFDLKLKRQ